MELLSAIFSLDNLRGQIALYKKGASGGARFVNLDELETFYHEKDWYFHTVTHDKNLVAPGKRGSTLSAQQFTVLWCDLDLAIKNPEKYPTLNEVTKLIQELKNLNIEPSGIVDSGSGLHVYWLLDRPVECKEYQSSVKSWITFINSKLCEVTGRNIQIDQTGDMARVLRLPETINSNAGKYVRLVHLNSNLRYRFEDLLALTTYRQGEERGTGKQAVKNRLLQAMGFIKTGVPSYTSNMIRSCKQVENFFRLGGDVTEPIWYGMAGLLPYTEDGLEYFINLSSNVNHIKDSDRSESGALAKIDQWKNSSDGPATCNHFYQIDPSHCKGCPHFKRVTSPIQLGYSKPVEVNIPVENIKSPSSKFEIEQESYVSEYVPPQPFIFDEKGSICTTVEDSTGKSRVKVICHNRVIPYKRIWSEQDNQEIIYFNIETPHDGWREIDLPLASLQGSCPGLNKLMGSGALVVNNHSSLMGNYLIQCVKYLQELKKVNQSYSRIGWRSPTPEETSRDQDDRFVLGDVTIYKSGEVKHESLTPDLKTSLKDIRMRGDIDSWRAAIAIFARPGLEKHLICFLGSFAVPLFRATDYHGLMINLLSRQSGSFKSFTLRAITSVYGMPEEKLILSRDSEKSIYAKIAARCDLPVTYDEITNIDRDTLSNLTYAITQGRRGDRLNQDSTLKVNDQVWRTIMFCSSNASLDDMLVGRNLAERMRLLELPINVSEIVNFSDAEARSVMDVLNNNYGQAGVLWIKYVMDNRDQLFKECNLMISELMTLTRSKNDKRFWVSYIAFVLVAARHTRKIGLHSFNLESISATCRSILESSSTKIESDDIPLPMYAQEFLSTHLDSTLTVSYNSVNSKQGEVKREPRSEVLIKIEIKSVGPGIRTRIGFIAKKAMQKFLTENRVTFKDFINELKNFNVLVDEHLIKRVTIPGTNETFRLTCFSIDLDRLDDIFLNEGEIVSKQSRVIGI
jgi:hypothetical protein